MNLYYKDKSARPVKSSSSKEGVPKDADEDPSPKQEAWDMKD